MATAGISQAELRKIKKPELQNMANDLGILTKGLQKNQLIDAILEVMRHPITDQVGERIQASTPGKTRGSPLSPSSATGQAAELSPEQFELRKLEINFELRKLEMQHEREMVSLRVANNTQNGNSVFRVESAVKLMPKLVNENEIDSYLVTFEKIAVLNNWPKIHWPALLQTQLRGKGLKVFSELSTADCKQYDVLKKAVLTAYEFSSEVYRKRFRTITKASTETYSDFAFKLTNMAKRWLTSLNAFDDINILRQVLLMEQFSESLPVEINLWLVDRKLKSIDEMARAVDQYVSLRKTVITNDTQSNGNVLNTYNMENRYKNTSYYSKPSISNVIQHTAVKTTPKLPSPMKCGYCKKPNHSISECRLKLKHETSNKDSQTSAVKETLLIGNLGVSTDRFDLSNEDKLCSSSKIVSATEEIVSVLPLHPLFAPFCKQAKIYSGDGNVYEVQYLRDTAALQSLLLESSVPASAYRNTGEFRLLKGVSNTTIEVPLVELHLKTDFLDQIVLCGLIKNLPDGVDFLLGNDLWFLTNPQPTVVDFDAVITRSHTEKLKAQESIGVQSDKSDLRQDKLPLHMSDSLAHYGNLELTEIKSCTDFKKLQQSDIGLQSLKHLLVEPPFLMGRSYYYMQDDVLMHHTAANKRLPEADQLVIPMSLRNKILHLAHDIPAAGHLGFAKTQARLWHHVYWPNIWKDTSSYLKSCDMCQRVGKGPKPIPAPLIPLPVVSEPFKRIAIDVVGPLPVCPKTNNRFILTILDLATHYPEAIPLTDHTSQTVARALVSHFSRFGFCEEILSDQGPDLVSELMQIFLNDFSITHIRASAYHPQSNGSCERFHRTMKNMIRSVVAECNDAWDECLPHILFAYREIPVETLGFSPFELMFGRDVRGPISLMKSQWKPTSLVNAKPNVIKFVLDLRQKLKKCQELALENANQAREKSKQWYDRKARDRTFEPGELVLVCLPVKGHPLEARYCGPYRILSRIGRVDYLIATPDKRKIQRICHVNMLKAYVERDWKFTQVNTCEVNLSQNESELNEKLLFEDPITSDFGPSVTDVDTGFQLNHLTLTQQDEITPILTTYKEIFSDKPGKTNLCSHSLQLQPGTRPIRMAPYRVNPQKAECIKKEIQQMLELGVIEESSSPFASPVVIVPKDQQGSVRFCCDFRRLNSATIPDSFPMTRVDDIIDKVGHAKFMTKLDLSKGYWQIPLDPETIPMSAFCTPHGLFQWKVMPFGLRNAPATFERLVKRVLAGLEAFTCSYLDDILIFSSSWSEHLCHLKKIFARIQSAGLTVKKSKCVFANAEVEYLGHKIGLGKVEPRYKTVQALLEFPRPSDVKQLRSFLGLAGYYRRFLPHYSDIAACLNNLLRKGVEFCWTAEAEVAYLDLKSRLASRPILRSPDFSLPFSLAVDASNIAIGANLFQIVDNIEHPICYFSKKLDKHQQRYSTIEKEALALVLAVRNFSVYFGSQPVTVLSDHSPLQFIQRMANYNNKLLRWAIELQQYNIHIVHRRGKDNLIPDILSRPSLNTV